MAEEKKENKTKVKIVDRIDYGNVVALQVELDFGDGTEPISEKLNFGWDAMRYDNNGELRYKNMLKEWARRRVALHKEMDNIKGNAPNKGDELEID